MRFALHIARAAALSGMFLVATAQAHGNVDCPPVPEDEWRPQMDLRKKLADEGWRVRVVKIWTSCYEVTGFDAKGEFIEAFFNPKTFDRIEAKR